MEEGIQGRPGRLSKRSKLPTSSQCCQRQALPVWQLPSQVPLQPPQPPAPDQDAASQWALFNPCWISFIFFLLCGASWAVIFPSVSSIIDTTWLVQIKMHLRIIKKRPSFPLLPFLPSSNSTQNASLAKRRSVNPVCAILRPMSSPKPRAASEQGWGS